MVILTFTGEKTILAGGQFFEPGELVENLRFSGAIVEKADRQLSAWVF